MPKRYRSSRFTRRVKRVMLNISEPKRVIQSKRNCQLLPANRIIQPFESGQTNEDNNAVLAYSSIESGILWKIQHNKFVTWPVPLLFCPMGAFSGYERQWNDRGTAGGDVNAGLALSVRNGKEVWLRGISLKMQWGLDRVVPWCNLRVMLVKSRKGDTPYPDTGTTTAGFAGRNSNFYMGYSQNKQLDMVDTARHKILKKWKFGFRQNQFTSIGAEATADGQAVVDASSSKMDSFRVVKSDTAKTAAEWLAYLEEEYPDYYIMTKDHNVQRTAFDSHLISIGYDASLKTLVAGDDFTDWPFLLETTPPTAKRYAVVDDQNNGNATTDIWDMYNNAGLNNVLSTGWFDDTNTTYKAHQVVLVEKPTSLGNAAPADDVVQYLHSSVSHLWIPGRLFGPGGRIRFDEFTAGVMRQDGVELEGVYEYNLLFYTYGNFKTWTQAGTGSNTPMMLHLNDFQQIFYFRDP